MECLLPPLIEANDRLNIINDVDEIMRKAIQAAELERQRPKILYLDNDDAIDDIHIESPRADLPTFIEDDQFDSEANFDEILIKNQGSDFKGGLSA